MFVLSTVTAAVPLLIVRAWLPAVREIAEFVIVTVPVMLMRSTATFVLLWTVKLSAVKPACALTEEMPSRVAPVIVRALDGVAVVQRDDIARRGRIRDLRLRSGRLEGDCIDDQRDALADQLLVGLQRDSRGLAGRGPVAVVDEDDVPGDRSGLRRGERRKRRLRLAVAGGAVVLDVQTRLASVRLTVAGADVTPLLTTVYVKESLVIAAAAELTFGV